MGMPVNAATFDNMVDENIEWLKKNAPNHACYRDHIIQCMDMAKKYYRLEVLPNKKDEEWDG